MAVTLHHQSPTRKAVEVTIPATEVSAAFNEVVAKIAPKVRIPGFRPGKAPRPVLMQKYAREIHGDVAQKLVESYFWKAAEEAGALPISHPTLEKLELNEGKEASFRAQFDVAPEVALPDYKALVLTKKKRAIDETAVDEHLEGLRQRATKLLPADDAVVAQGLVATCDIRVKPQGLKSKTYADQVLEIDATRPFDSQILGMKVDEKKTFSITHPSDDTNSVLAGKTLAYEVQVKDLRHKEVPDLNDDFAKDLGDFETLAILRAAVKKDLEEAADRDAVARLQATMLDTLLDAAPFEVPRSMVGLQLDDYCQEFAQQVARQGMDPKKMNWEAYRQYRLNEAERAVRSGYLLQAIGNAESIEVPEEDIDAEIRQFMTERQILEPFATFKAELERRGNTTEIKGRLRTDRIFNHLLKTAKVTEELLDRAAFEALVELERKREAGIPVNRFDAGGLEGGDLEGQEGGEPATVAPADHVHGPDCDHEHDAEPAKVKKPKQEAAEPAKAPVKKAAPKAKVEPPTEDKPKAKAKAVGEATKEPAKKTITKK